MQYNAIEYNAILYNAMQSNVDLPVSIIMSTVTPLRDCPP